MQRCRSSRGNTSAARSVVASMTTYGIIGAGHIGSQVARAVIGQGHDVVIANSRGPQTLTELVAELGPRARAGTAQEAAEAAEVAVVTVPLQAIPTIPVESLAGKIVLDTNNYYWERDGRVEALDRGETTVSGMLQEHLPTSKVVKAFNHIMAADITTDGFPAGSPQRRALATSSDFPEAVEHVVALYDALGFDAVDVSPLSESWRVERDRPAYVVRQDRDELVANLARAPRTI
nr:NAD(P)-binding domain-containing protein [Cellulomonas iranensis]